MTFYDLRLNGPLPHFLMAFTRVSTPITAWVYSISLSLHQYFLQNVSCSFNSVLSSAWAILSKLFIGANHPVMLPLKPSPGYIALPTWGGSISFPWSKTRNWYDGEEGLASTYSSWYWWRHILSSKAKQPLLCLPLLLKMPLFLYPFKPFSFPSLRAAPLNRMRLSSSFWRDVSKWPQERRLSKFQPKAWNMIFMGRNEKPVKEAAGTQ